MYKPKCFPIHDNVHGRIWITDLERDIINTPTFQRLRRIQQLGLASYVFPGATHNRFSHSLGVLALMQDIATQPALEIPDEDITLLRLAALLHDVGHYPFSHLGEFAYAKIEYFETQKQEVLDPETFTPKSLLDKAATTRVPKGDAHHEKIARVVIENRSDIRAILDKRKIDVNKLCQIIEGKYSGAGPDAGAITPLYTNLLNSECDCDRFDYLLRDSQFTGAPYGRIDLQYLIENMRIGETEMGKCLAIDKRHGMHALEHYFLSRYFMYAQIIFHKTIRGFEIICQAILLALAENKIMPANYHEIVEIIKKDDSAYLNFDDAAAITAMRAGIGENIEPLVKLVPRILVHRQPLKLVAENKLITKKGATKLDRFQYADNKEHLAKTAKVDPEEVVFEHLDLPIAHPVTVRLDGKNDNKHLEEFVKAAKLIDNGEVSLLCEDEEQSIVAGLVEHAMSVDRLYCLDRSEDENSTKAKLLRALDKIVPGHSKPTA